MRRKAIAALLIGCLTLMAAAATAQSIGGRITGTITDQTGAVIPNANLTMTNDGTGAQRHATADGNGFYVAPELPVGFYTLKVEASGFSPTNRPRVKVDVGSETRADVALVLQSAEEKIDVRGEAPLLQPDSSAISEVISNKQVDALPVNGRDYRRLTTLVPGSAPRSLRGSLGSFTVNGQREKANIFLIDGIDNNDSFRNQPSFNQGGVTGAPATLFPVDALAEFSIQTQGGPEYGRNAAAIIPKIRSP